MPTLRAAALTDIGRVRRRNEDRIVLDEETRLFGVADGIGGLPGGAEAAQLAVEAVKGRMRIAGTTEPDLAAAVREANETVADLGRRLNPLSGIGTTLTVGSFRGPELRLAHVGDSRCYVARAAEFTLLTEDHSVENEARRRRARGEPAYYQPSQRAALTRCIGQPPPLEIDLCVRPLAAGDRYLFCTDGITRVIPDGELAGLVGSAGTPQLLAELLVAQALRRGGPDNATAVVVFVDAL